MISTDYSQILEACKATAIKAGHDILASDPKTSLIRYKRPNNKSPETRADLEANRFIREELTRQFPAIPVIAEEDETRPETGYKRYFLVDPMDGTTSFVSGEREYTVNIALIEDGKPVLGVIWSPTQHDGAPERLYWGVAGQGAFRKIGDGAPEPIQSRPRADDGLVVIGGRETHSQEAKNFTQLLRIKDTIACSSSSKFCRLAEGSADFYPRFGDTMEWDIAAGHAILNAAGGHVIGMDGREMTYGKSGYKNPHFIAYGPDYRQAPRINVGGHSPH